MGSLKYTGRGASATEDIGIFNQIEEERHWNFVIVQLRNGPWTHGSVKIVGCWSLKTVSNFEPSPFNKLKSKALTIFVKVMYILQCTSISYYERRNCYFYFIQYFFFDNDFKFHEEQAFSSGIFCIVFLIVSVQIHSKIKAQINYGPWLLSTAIYGPGHGGWVAFVWGRPIYKPAFSFKLQY